MRRGVHDDLNAVFLDALRFTCLPDRGVRALLRDELACPPIIFTTAITAENSRICVSSIGKGMTCPEISDRERKECRKTDQCRG